MTPITRRLNVICLSILVAGGMLMPDRIDSSITNTLLGALLILVKP
jgi:hypothetical protein